MGESNPSGKLPRPQGVESTTGDRADSSPAQSLGFSSSATLADIAKEYKLFTPATIYQLLVGADPIADWAQNEESEPQIFSLQLPLPVFRNAPVATQNWDWSRGIMGLEHARWPSFLSFVGSCGMVDVKQRTYIMYHAVEVTIPDVLALAKLATLPDVCPTVEVSVFLADSNRYRTDIQPAKKLPLDLPTFVRHRPYPATVHLAEAFFAGSEDPMGEAEKAIRSEE